MCGGADGLSSANKSWNLCGFIRRGIPRHVFEQSVCQKRTNFCSMGTRESNQFWSRVEKSILRFHEISPWFCLWKKKKVELKIESISWQKWQKLVTLIFNHILFAFEKVHNIQNADLLKSLVKAQLNKKWKDKRIVSFNIRQFWRKLHNLLHNYIKLTHS